MVKPKRLMRAGKAGSQGAQLSTVATTGMCIRADPEMSAPVDVEVVVRMRACGDAGVLRVEERTEHERERLRLGKMGLGQVELCPVRFPLSRRQAGRKTPSPTLGANSAKTTRR